MKLLGTYYVQATRIRPDGRGHTSYIRRYHQTPTCRFGGAQPDCETEIWVDDDRRTYAYLPPVADGLADNPIETVPCAICDDNEQQTILATRGQWQERGRCFGTQHPGFHDFYARGSSRPTPLMLEALAMCNGSEGVAPCPVRAECRAYGRALHKSENGIYGILGGETHYGRCAQFGPASI